MYFSITRRRTFSRILWAIFTLLTALLVFANSPQLQKGFCPYSSTLYDYFAYVCPLPRDLFEGFNVLEHLGGNGPWFSRQPESDSDQLPLNCHTDQVHMISRHAERYPTANAGKRHFALLEKLKSPHVKHSGSLGFVEEWSYFTNSSNSDFEGLTYRGPFAGTLQAYNAGRKLRLRYDTLVDASKTTDFWTCDAERDIHTAKQFAKGFFGDGWESQSSARLHIIPETVERGADTLTPGRSCLKYIEDEENGHDRGYAELGAWQNAFTKPIAARLREEAGGLSFTPLEIYTMMDLCGSEVLATGQSPWCRVFTNEEWSDFEYGRDLLHFYRAGPGNDFAGAMGWLWLNATSTLLANDAARGVYFSFVHDGDIVPLLATLGILDEVRKPGYLPNNKVKRDRQWRTSDVVPMGGRLVFERVTCDKTGLGQNLRRSYVRLFINDGIVNLSRSFLGGGLANAVGLNQWADMVAKKEKQFGSFKDKCGVSDDTPQRISFLQPQYQS